MDKIFIHNDVENLKYFSNKHGISASIFDRATHYVMQGSDIVRIFNSQKEVVEYYNKNRYREGIPAIYFYNRKLMEKENKSNQ